MNESNNVRYHENALSLLHNQLQNCPWNIDEKSKDIDKKKLLNMFNDSCETIQRSMEHNRTYLLADAVFVSCIRAVRCICIEDSEASKILIQKKEYTLDAFDQYENALRNYKLLLNENEE